MALSSAQKLQFLRLPVVDASVSTDDKYAFLGVILTATVAGTLPEALRKQILRLPIVDASVSTSDKYALLGIFESSDAGSLYELFETAFLIDPTWTALESPQTNDGSVLAGISGFITGFLGAAVNPVIVIPNPGTPITNSNATTNVPTHNEACQVSGFRQYPDQIVQTWDGLRVRKKSFDPKHPSLLTRSTRDGLRSRERASPEPDDVFISTDVTVEDL
jgi:hypothetical protein